MTLQTALSYIYQPVERELVCRPDAISGLCDVLDRLYAWTAMIICGPTILQHANVVQRVQETLGSRCVGVFSGVLPHAPVEMFQEAVAAVKEAQPEVLVSVGGGSSHDTAKGLATVISQGGRIHDYETRFTPPDTVEFPEFTSDKMPVIAIPTRWAPPNSAAAAALRIRLWAAKSWWPIPIPFRAIFSSMAKPWRRRPYRFCNPPPWDNSASR
jgi:alcohol dehydrogenase